MREIKFRGYSEKYKIWIYGFLVTNAKGHYQIKHTLENGNTAIVTVEEKSIGQYTGLKDKNGKEIYEGDIALEYETKYIVRYEPTRGGFFPFACGDGCGCCDDEVVYNSKDAKIIGNIYDNPELLKEE